jgi:hypothetical protein
MRALPTMHVLIALIRDGFHQDSQGGTVALRDDGTPVLDYPLLPLFWEGARRALRTMAEIQFAAGAQTVMPVHAEGASFSSFADARAAIDTFELQPLVTPVVSAHVMGGPPAGPKHTVVTTTTPLGSEHMDGSLAAATAPHQSMYLMLSFATAARPAAILDLSSFQIDCDARLIRR